MECVTFHATELFGQNERLFLTEPCRSPDFPFDLAGFCVEDFEEALTRHGQPEIFNTDQGNQVTGFAFTERLRAAGVQISMDGRCRCMDHIFIERL